MAAAHFTLHGPRTSRDSSLMSMRAHELAVQRWLNMVLQVQDGYPVPVVFAPVMDAFSNFKNLWASPNNPYAYLLELKDDEGRPLYEPHPSNVRYPIISVQRRGWTFRSHQNWTLHPHRKFAWMSDLDEPERKDLSMVVQRQRPMAWDFRFQVDVLCLRPDTQAYFLDRIMSAFWRTGGDEPQTWIMTPYPEWFQTRYIRVKLLGGEVQSITKDQPEESSIVEYRMSFTLVVEGYKLDHEYDLHTTFWKLALNAMEPMPPSVLESLFGGQPLDLRDGANNLVLNSRENLPPVEDSTEPPIIPVSIDNFDSYYIGPLQGVDILANPFLQSAIFTNYGAGSPTIIERKMPDGHDQCLSIGNVDMVRPIGLVWTKVRIVLLYAIDADGPLTASLALGITASATTPVGSGDTGHFLGVMIKGPAPWTYNNVVPTTPYLSILGGTYLKKVVGVEEDVADLFHPVKAASTGGNLRRSMVVLEVERGSPNYQLRAWSSSRLHATIDMPVSRVLRLIRQPENPIIFNSFLDDLGSVAIPCNEVQDGSLDSLNVYWSNDSNHLFIHSLAIARLE